MTLSLSACHEETQPIPAPPFATKYFLDAPPSKDDLANLPPHARDVIVARVHISKSTTFAPFQDAPPGPAPKDHFWAQVEFLDVLTGAAKTGDQMDVFIANTPAVLRHITPATPAMKARTYFVAIFLNKENEHQLFGLPASQAEFERWEAELWKNAH